LGLQGADGGVEVLVFLPPQRQFGAYRRFGLRAQLFLVHRDFPLF
jgi:hypothetical protein